VDAERLSNGRMLVKLSGRHLPENESAAECDLLIVADGASSKIRASLRPEDILQYAGVMQKGGMAIFPNGIPKPVDKNWGMLLSSGKGVACFLSPLDETSLAWGMSYRAPTIEEPLKISSIEDAQSVIEDCRKLGKDFSDPFQSILDATNPKDVSRLAARDKQPFNHDLSLGPVLFIGDSNHAVSPFSGYGASLALKDGWNLSSQLCRSNSLEEAVKAYDAISVPRASKVLKESHQRIDMGHATGINYLFNRSLLSLGGFILGIKDAVSST
jgi:2-polyprenyl-6-methoxyphenol hydroxylase-like FAD-dependent oxidoreductase